MIYMLHGLIAGIAASLFCFIINSYLLNHIGNKAVNMHIPAVEEFTKTYFALIVNGNIIFCHIVFGTVEALYDLYSSPDEYSYTASVLSLVSHAIFGILTFYVIQLTGFPVLAVIISATIHSLWNRLITG